MRKAVVVLPPYMGSQQVIQRCNWPTPLDVTSNLQPLRVLVEHRVDDVDEGFVTRKEAMTAGQQVAFQPALAHVLAEHLHDAAVASEVLIDWNNRFHPLFAGCVIQSLKAVGRGLVWP